MRGTKIIDCACRCGMVLTLSEREEQSEHGTKFVQMAIFQPPKGELVIARTHSVRLEDSQLRALKEWLEDE
jgi:hypothetical protein